MPVPRLFLPALCRVTRQGFGFFFELEFLDPVSEACGPLEFQRLGGLDAGGKFPKTQKRMPCLWRRCYMPDA